MVQVLRQSSSCLLPVSSIHVPFALLLPQDCKPLWLTGRNGTRFDFVGVAAIAKGSVAAEASLVAPDAVGSGKQTALMHYSIADY